MRANTVAARIWLDSDDPARAVAAVEPAALTARRLGARLDEAHSWYVLGSAWRTAGDPDAARTAWQAAEYVLADTQLPATAPVRRLLVATAG